MVDINVLIYAHRKDSHREHAAYAAWLTGLATSAEPFALTPAVLSGLVRIVTNPRIFARPSTLEEVFAFIAALTERPTARVVAPGPTHLTIFETLCRQTRAAGKLVADADHAATAIEHGCEWITTDADFARFDGLRWAHPLARDSRGRVSRHRF